MCFYLLYEVLTSLRIRMLNTLMMRYNLNVYSKAEICLGLPLWNLLEIDRLTYIILGFRPLQLRSLKTSKIL